MSFISSLESSRHRHPRAGLDLETMINGFIMGLAVTGFVACAFLVVNGKAEKWLHLKGAPQTKQEPALEAPMAPLAEE